MMTRWTRFAILVLLASTSCAARGQAPQPASLFDPARHMRVSEVRPGMTGYGLSVFHGTQIERFDVQVISILHNFNPQDDVVLIRCSGANLEHTGPIAGMSGSPIYLRDDQGRDRLLGAFAYGWSLMKDPVAGVQPIQYMLEIGSTLKPNAAAATQPAEPMNIAPAAGPKMYRYDPLRPLPKAFLAPPEMRAGATQLLGGGDIPQLRPLATPLMSAGLSGKALEQFAPMLREYGLVPLQSGAVGGSAPTTAADTRLAPGSVLAAPLITGDVELTAIGTCTEVIGDRIFGFGHPFNNEGPIMLPMASGQINGIIASLSQSFKIGAITGLQGTLVADQAVGVAGKLGKAPPTIPVDIHVIYTDGSLDTKYHFNLAVHPRLTPLLAGVAISSALSGKRDLPQYHTVDFDLNLQFANDQQIQIRNVSVNRDTASVFPEIAAPVILAAENQFEPVMLKKMSGTVRISPKARQADILSVNLPKMKYRPGDTLSAFVRYRPFHQAEAIMPIELQLPHDLRDGKYALTICDEADYVRQEQIARPFRFTAESIDDIFDVLRDVASIRDDALYVRLMRQADGVAIGRTAMPLLPSSRRQVLLEAGRSNVSAYVSSTVKIIPTNVVMNGSASFEIEIDAQDHVEVGGVRAPRTEPRAPAAPLPDNTGRPRPAPGIPGPAEMP